MIKMIAAVGKNGEIGKDGNLIWHLPGDLKFFKEMTIGTTIVMGRKTFNSLPGKLKEREHVVLSVNNNFNKDTNDIKVFKDMEELKEWVKLKGETEDVFIIGGASLYNAFIAIAEELVITEIKAEDNDADTFFPDIEKEKFEKKTLSVNMENGIMYKHVLYTRK
ncbi:MAG: dihydrofolate reductase [Clostridia bacterium]|nr:dihydrofolate reductase [Clostridia bacterium]MDD4376104.1 dihydrofolate reductase [Clostridia bacterium]